MQLNVSDDAQTFVTELMTRQELTRDDVAVRLAVTGRRGGTFSYHIDFIPTDQQRPDDVVVDAGPFQVFVDAESAPQLEGATLDLGEESFQRKLIVDNPNPVWSDPLAREVQQVLDQEINPAVAQHGGWVELLGVEETTAYVELGGGCQGCGMANVTLKQGIETRITERVPQIENIVDRTDHAGGTNPYFQPAKGGGGDGGPHHQPAKGGSPFG